MAEPEAKEELLDLPTLLAQSFESDPVVQGLRKSLRAGETERLCLWVTQPGPSPALVRVVAYPTLVAGLALIVFLWAKFEMPEWAAILTAAGIGVPVVFAFMRWARKPSSTIWASDLRTASVVDGGVLELEPSGFEFDGGTPAKPQRLRHPRLRDGRWLTLSAHLPLEGVDVVVLLTRRRIAAAPTATA